MDARLKRFALRKSLCGANLVITSLGSIWFAGGAADFIKSEFLSSEEQHYQIVQFISSWSWQTWVVLGMALLIWVFLEGAYRRYSEREDVITSLQLLKSSLESQIKEVFVIVSERADVFVLLKVQNSTQVDTTLSKFAMLIETNPSYVYMLDGPLDDLSKYTRSEIDWSEDRKNRVKWHEPLVGIEGKITRQDPLRFGLPAEGWLHFRVEARSLLPPLRAKLMTAARLLVWNSFGTMCVATREGLIDNPSTLIRHNEVPA